MLMQINALFHLRTGPLAIVLLLAIFTQVFGQPAASVLFYGPNDSTESSFLPTNATFTVASEATWRAMTTTDFASYDLIIIGDPRSRVGPSASNFLAAYDTRNTWAAAVTGRIVVSGIDPAYHAVLYPGAETHIIATLEWLAKGPTGKTALYVSSDWGTRNLDFLSFFGAFGSSAFGAFGANTITITSPSHPIMIGSTSASLSDWDESAHSYLTYPASFSSLAIGTDGGTTGSVVVARAAPLLDITSQPADQFVDVGSTVTFAVSAVGTGPLAYQWCFNGIDLYRADNASFVLPNAQWSNAGGYSVVVSNAAGSITSRIALLTFPVHGFERITANPDRTVSLSLTGAVTTAFAPYYDLYPLDVSTNLMDWSRLSMLLRTNSSSNALSYLDRDGTNYEKRFYRTHTNILITPVPKPSGPYPVGTLSRLLTDPSRTNRNNIPSNSSFMVTFWYPAEATAGVLPEPLVESNATLYAYLNTRNPNIVARLVSHALPGVPLATNQTSYPVLLYSHGGGFRRQNTDKALELASHGYVVVAVDHQWATASVFPSGQVLLPTAIGAASHALFQPTLDNGIKDLQFVSDELNRLNTADALLAGRLDLDRLGVFGFSLGCVMAADFCRIDTRCKAAALLDSGPTLELSTNLFQLGLHKPFLSMSSAVSWGIIPPPILGRPAPIPGSAEWLASSLVVFTNATSDAIWFQIQDAGHQSFQDRGSLISFPTLASDPTPVSREQSRTVRACTLSFFDKYLKGEDDHLLDNPAVTYTNIINFRRK
jgi:hypothetical protein